jgi:uncharacterized membrane protein
VREAVDPYGRRVPQPSRDDRLSALEAEAQRLDGELGALRALIAAERNPACDTAGDAEVPAAPAVLHTSPAGALPPHFAKKGSAQSPMPRSADALKAAPPEPLTIDFSQLLGPRLAFSGGVIFLLGVIFFLALAINRHWLSPAAQCAIGALMSLAALGASSWIRRAHGQLQASLALGGAGIAGLWASLVAACSLYHLMAVSVGMGFALAIAGVCAAIALDFRSQALACLGFIPALVAGVILGVHTNGTSMALMLLLAGCCCYIAIRRGWVALPMGVMLLAWPQTLLWVHGDQHRAGPFLLAAAFGLLPLLAGVLLDRRAPDVRDELNAVLVSLPGGYLVAATALAVSGHLAGIASSALAAALAGAAYLCTAASLAAERRLDRDRLTVLWGTGVTLVAVAFIIQFFGNPRALTVSLAALAIALAGVARHTREARLSVAAALAATTASLIGLVLAARPDLLFSTSTTMTTQPAGAYIVGLAWATVAASPKPKAILNACLAAATTGCVYGLSLGVVAVLSSHQQTAQIAVTVLWVALGIAGLVAGLLIPTVGRPLRTGGFALLAAAVAKLFLFDLSQLDMAARAAAFVALGLALVGASFYYQRLLNAQNSAERPAGVPKVAWVTLASCLGVGAWFVTLLAILT